MSRNDRPYKSSRTHMQEQSMTDRTYRVGIVGAGEHVAYTSDVFLVSRTIQRAQEEGKKDDTLRYHNS